MYLIASWGSSGAGKTTVALAAAAALAKRKREVLVISTDSRTPSLPVFLPTVDLSPNQSIAELLTKTEITEAQLKGRIHKHPKSDYIFFCGIASGESATLSYGPPRREAVRSLIQVLQHSPFDFVMIDCDSNPVLDATSMIALEWAQFGFCTLSPDIRGYEYIKAQSKWLGNSDTFRLDNYRKIINGVRPATPVDAFQNIIGDVTCLLPYAEIIQDKMIAGEPLGGFRQMPAIEFERQINALVDELEANTIYA